MKKRIMSLIICVSFLFSIMSPVFAQSFETEYVPNKQEIEKMIKTKSYNEMAEEENYSQRSETLLTKDIKKDLIDKEGDEHIPNKQEIEKIIETKSYDEMAEEENLNQVNELLLIKEMKKEAIEKKGESYLASRGLSQDNIEMIKNFSFKNILDSYSEETLLQNGYNQQDLNILKKYSGEDILNIPDSELLRAGANLRYSMAKQHHLIQNGGTSAAVRMTWAWDKAPVYKGVDSVAVSWGRDFAADNDSIIKLEWVNENNLVLKRTSAGITQRFPNMGCAFNFGIAGHLGITRGAAYVHISRSDAQIRDFELVSQYIHRTIKFSWSLSIPKALSISPGEGAQILGNSYARFKK